MKGKTFLVWLMVVAVTSPIGAEIVRKTREVRPKKVVKKIKVSPTPVPQAIEINSDDLLNRFLPETRHIRMKLRERALSLEDTTTDTLDTVDYAKTVVQLLGEIHDASYKSGWTQCTDVIIPTIRPATPDANEKLRTILKEEQERKAAEAARLREEFLKQQALDHQARQTALMKTQVTQKEEELRKLEVQNEILAAQAAAQERTAKALNPYE